MQPNTILVVDDEPSVAASLKSYLELGGFAVETASSGADALSQAQQRPPNLVILDLRLPDISGYEVCQQLRKMYHPWSVSVLMLTGLGEPIDQLRGYAFGADAYLTKPVELPELVKTVHQLLGHDEPAGAA